MNYFHMKQKSCATQITVSTVKYEEDLFETLTLRSSLWSGKKFCKRSWFGQEKSSFYFSYKEETLSALGGTSPLWADMLSLEIAQK